MYVLYLDGKNSDGALIRCLRATRPGDRDVELDASGVMDEALDVRTREA